MTDATNALTAAVADNTAATSAAIAAGIGGAVVDETPITDAATQIEANTAALKAATPTG